PAASAARTSSASRPKSAERIDGAIRTGALMPRILPAAADHPGGEKRVGVVPLRPGPHALLEREARVLPQGSFDDLLPFGALEGADRVREGAARQEQRRDHPQELELAGGQRRQVALGDAAEGLGVAPQHAEAATRGVEQDAVKAWRMVGERPGEVGG